VNSQQFQALPKAYQSVLESACAEANASMLAKYDIQNPAALRRLVASGTQLRPYTREIMEACYKAAFELYDEIAATNAKFKKIYEAWKPLRDDEYLWFRVAEHTFDSFVYAQSARKR
jgi:TRAP-type mannitol/chloroaromatic compound transport system substrate-binding protein